MPLPAPPETVGDNNRRSRRTPSTDSSTAPDAASLTAGPTLVADTSTVPGVPSGNLTIRHPAPPTRRRPSTTSRAPHSG